MSGKCRKGNYFSNSFNRLTPSILSNVSQRLQSFFFIFNFLRTFFGELSPNMLYSFFVSLSLIFLEIFSLR
ncbi:hypothetical protein Mgra_00005685, partial [Meloidogyne graminicola]